MTATSSKQGTISHHGAAGLCLTPSDLRALGKNEVAYVRRYHVHGKIAFVLHAADGTAIAVQKDAQTARNAAQDKNLELLSIH